MKLLSDFPTIGEPHYAQALPASILKDRQLKMYPLAKNADPHAATNEEATPRGRPAHDLPAGQECGPLRGQEREVHADGPERCGGAYRDDIGAEPLHARQ